MFLSVLKEDYSVLLQNIKNMQSHASCFYAEPCRAEKHVQEDKNKKQAPDRAQWGVLESRILLGVVCLLIYKQLDMGLLQYKASKTSFLWLQATNLLGTSLGTHYGMG